MARTTRHYDGIQPTKSPEEVVAWLRDFHAALSAAQDVLEIIPE
jgi:hypothetical protein